MHYDTKLIWRLKSVGPLGRRWRLRIALVFYVLWLRRVALWVAGPHA
jgi:hypothetical protein